jgi:hypothetical protein
MTLRPALLLSSVALCVVTGCDKPKPGPDSPPTEATKAAPDEPGTEIVAGDATPTPTATAALGQPAPDFTLTDLDGNAHTLSQYKGSIVVLEWWNPQCPFVDYAHAKGPLVDMAVKEIAQGVVWLSINSGAPGKQGAGAEASRAGVTTFGMKNPVLLDEDGAVGRTYGAEKTPHMYVVDGSGTLVYRGGLDDAPMGEPEDGELTPHVANALADLRAGKPVAVAETKAYGCSVKYAKG